MGEKIRWGILGPGNIARSFAEGLRLLPDAELVAVGSRSIERSTEFCAKYGGKPYGSYEELVQDPNIDVMYVATPHMMHEEHVVLSLRAGKNVLCEKPLAINEAQAKRMYAEADKQGLFLMDGLWSRFFPAWEYAQEQVRSGACGKINSIYAATCWGLTPDYDPKGRLRNIDLAGGALLDAGIYSLASVSVLLGPDEYPSEIKVTSTLGETGVDEIDMITMRYPSGVLVTAVCGLQGHLHETHVMMERGKLTIPRHRNPDLIIHDRPTGALGWGQHEEVRRQFYSRGEGFHFEAAHVQECLRQGLKRSPRVSEKESLNLMRIMDEVRRQAGLRYPFE